MCVYNVHVFRSAMVSFQFEIRILDARMEQIKRWKPSQNGIINRKINFVFHRDALNMTI